MKLKALGRYQNGPRNIDVHPGDEIEVNDALSAFLMNDAPGCFAAPGQEQPAQEQADQPPFDLPPDGTTLLVDATPPVITGPESGVEITHRADAEEQAATLAEQATAGESEDEEPEDGGAKGLDAPPEHRAIRRAPRQK